MSPDIFSSSHTNESKSVISVVVLYWDVNDASNACGHMIARLDMNLDVATNSGQPLFS